MPERAEGLRAARLFSCTGLEKVGDMDAVDLPVGLLVHGPGCLNQEMSSEHDPFQLNSEAKRRRKLPPGAAYAMFRAS